MQAPLPNPPAEARILITGASGALGGALARQLAGPGNCLLLWGRDAARLAAIATACRTAGSEVSTTQVDFADIAAALAALAEADAPMPIDQALLVAGQGDSVPAGLHVEPAAQVARLAQVNFSAPASLAAALAARMAGRGRGRILLVGSAAAFHALPHAPTYAASKAGLARFAQALRIAMAPHGVQITLVSPGFIDWAGGGRPVPRALLLPLDVAARRILAAFAAGVGHAVIPRRFQLLRLVDRLLPGPVRAALLRRIRP
ncbi:MAG: SDR family NAD(P)-dependent oxidoreductase [Sphingomonadales bacterium]